MKVNTLALALALCCASASATEIIYTPINPTFGGNPLNGSYILSKANAQNDHSESRNERDFVTRFKESLERNLMNQITRQFADGTLTSGEFDTGDYLITVVETGDGSFQVTIVNEITGETTVIEMVNPMPPQP